MGEHKYSKVDAATKARVLHVFSLQIDQGSCVNKAINNQQSSGVNSFEYLPVMNLAKCSAVVSVRPYGLLKYDFSDSYSWETLSKSC